MRAFDPQMIEHRRGIVRLLLLEVQEPVALAPTSVARGDLGDGVTLLENLRFDPREASKDAAERESYAAELAALGDVFVSDGFGVVHRKQASVYELAKALPSAAGLLIAAELDVLDRLTANPASPYTVFSTGAGRPRGRFT